MIYIRTCHKYIHVLYRPCIDMYICSTVTMQQYSYGVGEWCTSHIHTRFLPHLPSFWAAWEPGFQSLVASCNDWARPDPLSERVGLEEVGGWVWNSKHVPLPDFMTNGWWPINKKTCPILFGFGIVNFFRHCHSLALGKLKRHTHTHRVQDYNEKAFFCCPWFWIGGTACDFQVFLSMDFLAQPTCRIHLPTIIFALSLSVYFPPIVSIQTCFHFSLTPHNSTPENTPVPRQSTMLGTCMRTTSLTSSCAGALSEIWGQHFDPPIQPGIRRPSKGFENKEVHPTVPRRDALCNGDPWGIIGMKMMGIIGAQTCRSWDHDHGIFKVPMIPWA